MTEGIREIPDHGNKCTWHDLQGVRCGATGVIGSAKACLCRDHEDTHRKVTMDPEAYAAWRAAKDAWDGK